MEDSRLRHGLIAAVGMAGFLASCTVQPLYQADGMVKTLSRDQASSIDLKTIAVSPVSDRVSQQARNHLIFLLGGGAGEPAQPLYTLTMAASVAGAATASIQQGRDEEPTAEATTVSVNYALRDNFGNVLSSGTASSTAALDVSRQQFSALRARADAQNRAAREAAEFVRLGLLRDLGRISG